MTTTREVISRIRRKLLGSRTEQINKLSADLTGTTISLAHELKGISTGARLSVELEDLFVWTADATTRTAVVERGFESSAAVFHPVDTVVRVSPRVSDAEILIALNDHIRGLAGEGIYRMGTTEMLYTPSTSTYELPADVLSVYRVHSRDLTESEGWIRLHGWIYDRDQNVTDHPSGITMTFTREVPPSGFTFRVAYRRALGTLSSLDEVVETVVGTEAIDLLVLGAEMRLTDSREAARNVSDAQGSTRRAQEVPPGAEMGANRGLQQQYQQALFREKSRLTRLYPQESKQW